MKALEGRERVGIHTQFQLTHVHTRREFVTGFQKRKQQRRKEAQRKLEKKAREERNESRAEVNPQGGIRLSHTSHSQTWARMKHTCIYYVYILYINSAVA